MTTIVVTDSLVVGAGETHTFADEPAFGLEPHATGPANILTIDGMVEVSLTPSARPATLSAIGVDFFSAAPPGAAVTIDASGVLRVTEGPTHVAFNSLTGFSGSSVDVDLVNHGTVLVEATGAALGASSSAPSGWELRNTGSFTVTSHGGEAQGVITTDGFFNSGQFLVTGQTQTVAVDVTFPTGSIYNSGSIRAVETDPSVESIGVLYRSLGNGGSHFTNDGRIEADVSLRVISGSATTGAETYVNNGALVGRVDMGDGPSHLVNSGSIQGAIGFGGDNDVYDGRLGTEAGLVSGGAGDDTLTGGAGFDNLQGNQGNDSEAGGAGDDIVVGGKDNDQQTGDDGNDVVWGNLGNDTLDGGAGADQVRGGQGDDSVSGGAGNDFVSGDRGNDTETGGAGADNFHGSQDAGIDRVLDFNLAEGDRVELDPGTTYTVSQVGADTVIDMGASNGAPNQMILVGVQMSTLHADSIFLG
jgi:Ca2+-binding RTX toxin-like protein